MATHLLPLKLIQRLVDNYKNRQLYSIENSVNYPMAFDATAALFSLEQLKDFIATIEKEVAKHPDRPVSNIGIRFYYAAYPENLNGEDEHYEALETVNPEYAKLHTLIAVPSIEIEGLSYDFDPSDVNTYSGQKPSGTGIAIMAENHGVLFPPVAKIGLWF
jgi:hypothetical protein